MNKKKKNEGSKRGTITAVLVWAVMYTVYRIKAENVILEKGDILRLAFPILLALVTAGIINAVKAARKKNSAAQASPHPAQASPRPAQASPHGKTAQPRPAAAAQRRAPTAAVRPQSEQAVHCAHSRGKEKYIEQLDGFLANGIIDRAEYNLMKARYSKLEIEDDYH